MSNTIKSVAVFCGSASGESPIYREAATAMGHLLADRGIQLVYGGGNIGLMGIIAEAVLEKSGKVIGVIPKSLENKELAHMGLTDLRIVESMHERKALMADLSDGFIAMPGGFGTLDELCEILTWAQLSFHSKPIGLLNINGFFDPLLLMFDHAIREGFLKPDHIQLVSVAREPEAILHKLESAEPLNEEKWWSDKGKV
ncbi:TIGR00730 family Rossman fold protein [Verrucomicrobia bacterium]|nr:TIGR00730 family Rossman fold protein [Verrucomicrobiota bacterium]MDB4458936.1 TIGR00730 family Rossman fold protein [bacterium]